jgi:hypothetical protein
VAELRGERIFEAPPWGFRLRGEKRKRGAQANIAVAEVWQHERGRTEPKLFEDNWETGKGSFLATAVSQHVLYLVVDGQIVPK